MGRQPGYVAIIGGFATHTLYYTPLQNRLASRGIEAETLRPGWFGLNVWPISVFDRHAKPALADKDDIVIIGHSLGGLQGIWLADQIKSIRLVIAIGSPIHGSSWAAYEASIRTLLGASNEFMVQYRSEIVPRVAPRLVTISSTADDIAPAKLCVVEGATNHQVVGLDHIIMPFVEPTLTLIENAIRERM